MECIILRLMFGAWIKYVWKKNTLSPKMVKRSGMLGYSNSGVVLSKVKLSWVGIFSVWLGIGTYVIWMLFFYPNNDDENSSRVLFQYSKYGRGLWFDMYDILDDLIM